MDEIKQQDSKNCCVGQDSAALLGRAITTV